MHGPSILFREPERRREEREAPLFFRDLNLDQIVSEVTAGRQAYDLAPLFQAPLEQLDDIAYRHEVMRDFEDAVVMRSVKEFSSHMQTVRKRLEETKGLRHKYEQERWFLGAVELYCTAVESIQRDLYSVELRSRGFRSFRSWLSDHVCSAAFASLATEARKVEADLSAVRYCLHIHGDTIVIRDCGAEIDYTAAVQAAFEKFRRGGAKEYAFKFPEWLGMDHIEAGVLAHVAELNPAAFGALEAFFDGHQDFLDPTIVDFERESQFYVAWLEYVVRFRHAGLSLCQPELSASRKEERCADVFDLALAQKLLKDGQPVVCNDYELRGRERILVVSGPNQGGKTTFARTFGQLHHMARVGCSVAGSSARLFLPDGLFAHFEREEDVTNLRGKLHDDLIRIRKVLDEATSRSVIIMNEIFSSTTLNDSVFLSRKVLARISNLDALCVCVTFLGELASLDDKTVSMVSMVDPVNPVVRTYKLERRPDEGIAYALALAERHRVTYSWLKDRVGA